MGVGQSPLTEDQNEDRGFAVDEDAIVGKKSVEKFTQYPVLEEYS